MERWTTLLFGLALWLVFSGAAAANPTAGQMQERNYANGNNIKTIAAAAGAVWTATEGGAVRWSRADDSYVKYTTTDDGLGQIHAPGLAWAAEEGYPPACDYSFPTHTDFGLATIANREERVYFYSDSRGCPEGQSCRREAYVIPGDTLIISNRYRDWVCAWYEPAEGAPTVGWVKTGNLDIQPAAANPPEPAWLGAWHDGPANTITIQENETLSLAASGEAYLQGSTTGAVNTGQFSGPARLKENHLTVVDENFSPCVVSMHLVGSYLIVRDTHQCGGMNVVFDGVYQKRDQP